MASVNRLKRARAEGLPAFGLWSAIPDSFAIEQIAGAVLDYVLVDQAKLVVRRSFEGNPLAVTDVYVHPEVGRRMRAEGAPPDGPGTVMSAVQDFLPLPVAGVSLDVAAVPAPAGISALMGCESGEAILHVERLYYDSAGTSVGFAVSRYNPRRYSYRLELCRKTTP